MSGSIFIFLLLFSVFEVYKKTENALASAAIWAVVTGILALFSAGISLKLFSVLLSFFVAWGTFSLGNYLEESVFLRLFVLIFGMIFMLISLGIIK